MDSETKSVDFGRQQVSPETKTEKVHEVFRTVASRYDAMNDLMSLGSHRLMKRIALEYTGLREGCMALDVAGGTGDVAKIMKCVVGNDGQVVLFDINEDMLRVGRDRLLDAGLAAIEPVVGDAEKMPFPNDSFHALTVCFGLRNMTDKDQALAEMHRVLKPAGRMVVLDFSKPERTWLSDSFALYRRLWPLLGHFVVGESQPYSYLIESIENHPTQPVLKQMIEDAGFREVYYENLLGGIVAIHGGLK